MRRSSARLTSVMGAVCDTTSQVSISMLVVRLEANREKAVGVVTNMEGSLSVSNMISFNLFGIGPGVQRSIREQDRTFFDEAKHSLGMGTVCCTTFASVHQDPPRASRSKRRPSSLDSHETCSRCFAGGTPKT